MDRSEKLLTEVTGLYQKTTTSFGAWMWHNHVRWVADRARLLAEKYQADAEKAYCAALLHDLADCRYERDDENFKTYSDTKGKELLQKVGFSPDEATEIVEVIIRHHSCHPGSLPATIEGKVLATADAMFHLQTSFFPMLCYLRRPQQVMSYEAWQDWFSEKVEREYNIKIFFEDERAEVKADYEALKRVFGNKTLKSEVA